MPMMSLVESELGGPSVFKDLARLDFDYVPDDLPHREEAVRFLSQTYRGLTQGGRREHAFLWGPVGTGKTVVAKRFARDFQGALRKRGQTLDHVHVNCRSRKSAGLVMLGVLQHFDKNYPERGFSVGEMIQDLRKQLERRDTHLLVILDEVDALLRTDGSDLVYDLTRLQSEGGPAWPGVSLVLISQEDVLGRLDEASLSTFKRSNSFRLDPYGPEALEAITGQRVEMAFQRGAVEDDTVSLVADTVAAQGGSARLAIEILQKAGRLADDEGSQHVTPEHIRAAKADSWSHITTTKLQAMPKHPLLVLLALARRLQKDQSAYATTGNVEKAYGVVCEEFGETARGHTQFWKYLNQLRDAGFLLSRLSGKGHAGTTQLLSIPDAPAAAVAAKVSEMVATAPE